jgi:hypothetical protein
MYTAIAQELSYDMEDYIKQQYPKLSKEIIDEAIKHGEEYLTLYGGTNRVNSPEAQNMFLGGVLESLKAQQEKVLEIFKTVMLARCSKNKKPKEGELAYKLDSMVGREPELSGYALAKQFKKKPE